MAQSVIVVDVNETLLDMSLLDPHFQNTFGGAKAREEWFMLLTQLWMTATITGAYQPFDKLSAAALDMIAEKKSVSLTADNKKTIAAAMLELPAHADVKQALSDLRSRRSCERRR